MVPCRYRFLLAGTENLSELSDSLCHALLHPAVTCRHRSLPPRPSQWHCGACSVAAGCGSPYQRYSDPPIPSTKTRKQRGKAWCNRAAGVRLILKREWEERCSLCLVKYGLLKKSCSFNYSAFLPMTENKKNDGREDQQYELIGPLSFCCKCTWFTCRLLCILMPDEQS